MNSLNGVHSRNGLAVKLDVEVVAQPLAREGGALESFRYEVEPEGGRFSVGFSNGEADSINRYEPLFEDVSQPFLWHFDLQVVNP